MHLWWFWPGIPMLQEYIAFSIVVALWLNPNIAKEVYYRNCRVTDLIVYTADGEAVYRQ
jgi:hypothetical protein